MGWVGVLSILLSVIQTTRLTGRVSKCPFHSDSSIVAQRLGSCKSILIVRHWPSQDIHDMQLAEVLISAHIRVLRQILSLSYDVLLNISYSSINFSVRGIIILSELKILINMVCVDVLWVFKVIHQSLLRPSQLLWLIVVTHLYNLIK